MHLCAKKVCQLLPDRCMYMGKPVVSIQRKRRKGIRVKVMLFNAAFNNISAISWRSSLLVVEIGVPEENHRPVANHWHTLSHNVVSSAPRLNGIDLTTLVVIDRDWIGSCKSNYHEITTTKKRKGETNYLHFKQLIN